MTKHTTMKIAKIAARILDGGKYSKQDVLALAGSALAQAERDEEVVKAWTLYGTDGLGFRSGFYWTRKWAEEKQQESHHDCKVVRVEIRRIGKAKRRK